MRSARPTYSLTSTRLVSLAWLVCGCRDPTLQKLHLRLPAPVWVTLSLSLAWRALCLRKYLADSSKNKWTTSEVKYTSLSLSSETASDQIRSFVSLYVYFNQQRLILWRDGGEGSQCIYNSIFYFPETAMEVEIRNMIISIVAFNILLPTFDTWTDINLIYKLYRGAYGSRGSWENHTMMNLLLRTE